MVEAAFDSGRLAPEPTGLISHNKPISQGLGFTEAGSSLDSSAIAVWLPALGAGKTGGLLALGGLG